MFEVLYNDENAWVRIDEAVVCRVLANSFIDVNITVSELKAGYEVPTSFARYRYTSQEER